MAAEPKASMFGPGPDQTNGLGGKNHPQGAQWVGLEEWIAAYENTAASNEFVFASFGRCTDAQPWLKAHRDWVEAYRFGYGQRAFHHQWALLIERLGRERGRVRFLEIGVYKGQILSLVSLLGRRFGVEVEVTAVSPFEGNQPSLPAWRRAARFAFDASWREQYLLGNLHPAGDYLADCRTMFAAFGLNFGAVRVLRGLSTDPAIVAHLAQERFDVVFIDGDHSHDVARFDIATYTPLVEPGGYAVIDDGAYFLPGRGYFKGMKSVSLACRLLEDDRRWSNVLNVGHNRIFQRQPGRPQAP